MQVSRRGLLFGAASLLAAPAIVRVSSIMPVKVMLPPEVIEMVRFELGGDNIWRTYRREYIAMFEETYARVRNPNGLIMPQEPVTWKEVWVKDDATVKQVWTKDDA